jgi:DNA polymerase I-like protein with 3'-5' exonuclease and polymerase domains
MTGERKLLNIRKMFKPDPNHILIDADLAGADARVFAWEIADMFGYSKLKEHMKTGVAIHVESNKFVFPALCGPDGRAEPYYTEVKSAFFGTCYGGGVRTLSENLAWPEYRTRQFQSHVFARFPEIKRYHERVDHNLQVTREVWTRFGYSIHYFGDVSGILPEALAWVPQATVANIAMYGALSLRKTFPRHVLRILLQVHDSLIFQMPLYALPLLSMVRDMLNNIAVPYKDPLKIPWNFKWSSKSWGDCEGIDWSRIPGIEDAHVQELASRVLKVHQRVGGAGDLSLLDWRKHYSWSSSPQSMDRATLFSMDPELLCSPSSAPWDCS